MRLFKLKYNEKTNSVNKGAHTKFGTISFERTGKNTFYLNYVAKTSYGDEVVERYETSLIPGDVIEVKLK